MSYIAKGVISGRSVLRMSEKKSFIDYNCAVCNKQLYFYGNGNRNYNYHAIKGKGYYLCCNCKIRTLKRKLEEKTR